MGGENNGAMAQRHNEDTAGGGGGGATPETQDASWGGAMHTRAGCKLRVTYMLDTRVVHTACTRTICA